MAMPQMTQVSALPTLAYLYLQYFDLSITYVYPRAHSKLSMSDQAM